MMLRYMLDTNICIYTMKNKPDSVREAFKRHQGQLCISSVVLSELLFGAEKSNNRPAALIAVESFAARLTVLSYSPEAAVNTAQIRADLQRQGKPIGPYDVMIAGHAQSLGLILVSNNTKEFDRVAGLRLENWVNPSK